MKLIPVISTTVLLGFVSCESMNTPISSGDFDPLSSPGGGSSHPVVSAGQSFKPGQFVRTAIDNTAFYKTRPKGDAEADKLLSRYTQMKVISSSSSYVRVELDSGEVGFVPTVMLEDPSAADTPLGAGDAFSVYPPFPDAGPVEPLPVFDAAELPPEGAVPPVIDPGAPIEPAPAAEPTHTDPTPTEAPTTEKVPLPPGIENAE